MLGAKSMMIGFGEDVAQCILGTDSSSANSMSRLDSTSALSHFVVARTCRFDDMCTEKRKGEHNTADIGTKPVTAPALRKHLKTSERNGAMVSRLEQGCESL